MDEHTLVAAERDIATNRSMRTSLKGGGTTGWSLVRAKVAPLCWFARESSRIRPLPV